MTPEQEKLLKEVHTMLTDIKNDYKTFKDSTGFDPTDEGGCPKLT